MDSAVWALIGTLVGAVASIATTWISARSAFAMQSAASALEREEQHKSFQRTTLLELQDALHDLLRLSARAYLDYESAFAKTGAWAKQQLSDEVDEGIRLGIRRVVILKERVSDEALRSDLKQFIDLLGDLFFARTREDAERLFRTVASDSPRLMEHIGRVLRSQYTDDRLETPPISTTTRDSK